MWNNGSHLQAEFQGTRLPLKRRKKAQRRGFKADVFGSQQVTGSVASNKTSARGEIRAYCSQIQQQNIGGTQSRLYAGWMGEVMKCCHLRLRMVSVLWLQLILWYSSCHGVMVALLCTSLYTETKNTRASPKAEYNVWQHTMYLCNFSIQHLDLFTCNIMLKDSI